MNYRAEISSVRHAVKVSPCMHTAATMGHMSAQPNRKRRAENAPTVLLQGRVAPQVRDEVHAAAQASGVSLAYYLEALITDLVRERGSLPLVTNPRAMSQQEELPIPIAS